VPNFTFQLGISGRKKITKFSNCGMTSLISVEFMSLICNVPYCMCFKFWTFANINEGFTGHISPKFSELLASKV